MSFRSKVVIRNLPADITNRQLESLISPWLEHIDYVALHPGKMPGRPSRKARAFIGFKDPHKLLEFVQKYDVDTFVDEKSQEHRLVIEFAPHQTTATSGEMEIKTNPYCNTLDTDVDFINYVNSLRSPTIESPLALIPWEEQIEKMMAKERELNPWKYSKISTGSTPLLEYLMKDVETSRIRKSGDNTSTTAVKKEQGTKEGSNKFSTKKKKKSRKKTKGSVPNDNAPKISIPPPAETNPISRTGTTATADNAEERTTSRTTYKILTKTKSTANKDLSPREDLHKESESTQMILAPSLENHEPKDDDSKKLPAPMPSVLLSSLGETKLIRIYRREDKSSETISSTCLTNSKSQTNHVSDKVGPNQSVTGIAHDQTTHISITPNATAISSGSSKKSIQYRTITRAGTRSKTK